MLQMSERLEWKSYACSRRGVGGVYLTRLRHTKKRTGWVCIIDKRDQVWLMPMCSNGERVKRTRNLYKKTETKKNFCNPILPLWHRGNKGMRISRPSKVTCHLGK